MDKTSDFRIGVSNWSRGSLRGAISEEMISSNVGTPIFSFSLVSFNSILFNFSFKLSVPISSLDNPTYLINS